MNVNLIIRVDKDQDDFFPISILKLIYVVSENNQILNVVEYHSMYEYNKIVSILEKTFNILTISEQLTKEFFFPTPQNN